MSNATKVPLSNPSRLYKALACLVLALIALQYILSGGLDTRPIEGLFSTNGTRYPEHSPRHHQRGLIIYRAETAQINLSVNLNQTSTTTVSTLVVGLHEVNNVTKFDTNTTKFISPLNKTIYNSTLQQRCPLVPPNLVGPLAILKNPPEMSVLEKRFKDVIQGGRGTPKNCESRHRVAIIIPYRDRYEHLVTFLYNLHPVLLRQQIDYQIFVVEQEGTGQFNRAMLMNVGSVEALKERQFDCFIFHDVDLLPEDDRNLYTCPEQPRHMSVAVDKFRYRLPYADLFGGVSALSREHFQMVNGFSNAFWGWGGEDDDMANRIKARGLYISRYPANIARYKMLSHQKEKANPKRYEILRSGEKRFTTDGLKNLRYELVDKKAFKLYTWLLVRLAPMKKKS